MLLLCIYVPVVGERQSHGDSVNVSCSMDILHESGAEVRADQWEGKCVNQLTFVFVLHLKT